MLRQSRVRLNDVPIRQRSRVWFVQHVAFSLMLHLRPKVPAVNYKVTQRRVGVTGDLVRAARDRRLKKTRRAAITVRKHLQLMAS